MKSNRVYTVQHERTSLLSPSVGKKHEDDDNEEESETSFSYLTLEQKAKLFDMQSAAANQLSVRLLNITSEDDEVDVLRETLDLSSHTSNNLRKAYQNNNMMDSSERSGRLNYPEDEESRNVIQQHQKTKLSFSEFTSRLTICPLLVMTLLFFATLGLLMLWGVKAVGPPNRPIGAYRLIERQEGMEFFDYYTFYEGRDSVGSNGFNVYVSQQRALELRIINATMEQDMMDVFEDSDNKINDFHRRDLKSSLNSSWSPSSNETVASMKNSTSETSSPENEDDKEQKNPSETHPKRNIKDEPFLYMSSASSPEPWGPRQSIRLEGKRRFHRGLFILDLRHMPTGCGVWPAFWLTDEANWPVNGEIDIVEGVNFQSVAKTALHTTQTCLMDDVPMGVKTGSWDEAVGIPNKKTGIPDMTLRYATDCYVYNPHQWLNQGCVAVDLEGGTLGMPLNQKGGGVFVLEWDPVFGHIRSWVFSPHSKVPPNLRQAIRTASEPNPLHQVAPDPNLWPLPYGYFAIGDNTDCPSDHFKNMRLVFNLAFCGSVAGNRFQMDCPVQAKKFPTCNDWLKSEPAELEEAYWKIRGVYVYQREWERAWM